MNRTPIRIAWVTAALLVVVFVNARVMHGALGHWLAGTTGQLVAPVASKLAALQSSIGAFVPHGDMAQENESLRQQIAQLQAQLAGADQARQDAAFYRAASGVRTRSSQELLSAGMFSWPQQGGVREAIINRGSRDGVAVGDAVVTANQALIGVVNEVFTDHATVKTLGDPTLEVAGRVIGSLVTGLVRMDAANDLVLDLVQNEEHVQEGQLITTSGNDQLPAGLVIGTVRTVDTTQATLFSLVRIAPAVTMPLAGSVLIIRP